MLKVGLYLQASKCKSFLIQSLVDKRSQVQSARVCQFKYFIFLSEDKFEWIKVDFARDYKFFKKDL